MYGLTEQIDLSFLKGRELIQISIGMFQVTFNFDDEVSISVEGSYIIRNQDRESRWTSGAIPHADVLNLLGTKIVEVRGETDGTLTLSLSENQILVIFDSSKEYESYQIAKPGSTIVV